MIAVLDTNVWLDWLVFDDPGVRPLRAAFEERGLRPGGGLRLVASEATRAELAAVLQRPRIHPSLPAEAARRLDEFDRLVNLVADPPASDLPCRDPDDQMFIDLAVAVGARWLLTKDKALLALARAAWRRHAVRVLDPVHWTGCSSDTHGTGEAGED
ncbi:MAG TPA: putative toxin-antitoxin system toxin component, PIN family [Burkholderiaceae bacterium]|mgnify:CR=1 FL=1|nr:putative toxin-antitoxin system toxin component, PIN family [Burkholderiaceae bacterium]